MEPATAGIRCSEALRRMRINRAAFLRMISEHTKGLESTFAVVTRAFVPRRDKLIRMTVSTGTESRHLLAAWPTFDLRRATLELLAQSLDGMLLCGPACQLFQQPARHNKRCAGPDSIPAGHFSFPVGIEQKISIGQSSLRSATFSKNLKSICGL